MDALEKFRALAELGPPAERVLIQRGEAVNVVTEIERLRGRLAALLAERDVLHAALLDDDLVAQYRATAAAQNKRNNNDGGEAE
jgi:hypothetical protein